MSYIQVLGLCSALHRISRRLFLVSKKAIHAVRRQLSTAVTTLRTNRGAKIKSHDFADYCLAEGIHQEFTAPFCPEQNGVSERDKRTFVEAVRSMLYHHSGLPLQILRGSHSYCHVYMFLTEEACDSCCSYSF